MCFTIPKKIKKLHGSLAVLENGNKVDISFIEDCNIGDFVIVTEGIAISKLEPSEAISIRTLIKETNEELS